MTIETKKTIEHLKSNFKFTDALSYALFYNSLSVGDKYDKLEILAIANVLHTLYITEKYRTDNGISIENAEQCCSFINYVKSCESIEISDNFTLKYSDLTNHWVIELLILKDTSTFDNVIKEFNKLPFTIIVM